MVRDAHIKSLFNTGVVLYVIGVAVLCCWDDFRRCAESFVGAGCGEFAV
jgi:hypothetical protein